MNEPSPRRKAGHVRALALLAVLAVLGAGGAGYAVGRTSDGPSPAAGTGTGDDGAAPATGEGSGTEAPEPGSVEAIAAQLAEDQAAERADLAADLSAAAEEAYDRLMPVLAEVAETLPVDGGTGPAADPDELDRWLREVAAARATLAAVPEGTSEHTVTRAAFLGAVDLLDAALRDLALRDRTAASTSAAAAPSAPAGRRDAAVELWLAGAAQLDSLMIGSSGDHVHLFLTPDGDPRSVPREFADHPEDSAG